MCQHPVDVLKVICHVRVGSGMFFISKVLNPSDGMCDQKGSFVDDEKLRFDFSWSGALSAEQVCFGLVW